MKRGNTNWRKWIDTKENECNEKKMDFDDSTDSCGADRM